MLPDTDMSYRDISKGVQWRAAGGVWGGPGDRELWGKAAVIETWLTRCSHRGRVQGNHVVGGRNSMSKGLEVGIRLADLRNRKKLVFLGSPE